MPMIQTEKFYRVHEQKKEDTFTVKLNEEERRNLEEWKKAIHQEKDSTALKQLAYIGAEVILDQKTKKIIEILLNNYRKNKRLGVVSFD